MKILSKLRLAQKLPLIIVAVAALAILSTSVAGYLRSSDSVLHEAEVRLQAVTEAQAHRVEELLARIETDLSVQSRSNATQDALAAFSSAFALIEATPGKGAESLMRSYIDDNPHPLGDKDLLMAGDKHPGYDAVHRRYHPFFDHLQNEGGYYDVFLIDPAGNIVYSVFKELDFATNLTTGKWKSTGLGRAFRAAMNLTPGSDLTFDDFAPYAPSNDAPAAFLAKPVFDAQGKKLGVLAYQMPIGELNAVVNGFSGLGQSGYAYLVGSDGMLRSDTPRTETDDILATTLTAPELRGALMGESGITTLTDLIGVEVMADYTPINAYGVNWSIVAAEDMAELTTPAKMLRNRFALIGAGLMIGTILLAGLVARSISRPLAAVNDAMAEIASKKYDTDVPALSRGDEIGEIARTLEGFRTDLIDFSATAREAVYKSAAFLQSSSAMLMVDTDFQVLYANDALTELMAYRVDAFEEITGARDAAGLIGQDMNRFHKMPEQVRARLQNPDNLPLHSVINVGGSYFDLAVNAILDENGQIEGYLVEWKNQTKSLRDASIMAALDATAARIELGPDGRIIWANEFVCEALGLEVSQLLGQPGSAILTPNEAGFKGASLTDIVGAGEHVAGVCHLAYKDTAMDLDVQIVPVKNPMGRSSGVVILGHDVTKARRDIAKAKAEQAELNAEQDLVVLSLTEGLGELAAGNFGVRLDHNFAPRYEQLRSDFNQTCDQLESTISGIILSAGSIRNGTSEISDAAMSLSRRTEAQAATLEETAAALDQLTASVKTASEGAEDAAGMVLSTRQSVEASGAVVEDAVKAMGEIERFSGEISKISGVIDDIAFQTNLLALNAGVEAARAGDSGRGFAVVASEVRALAQRSSDAAREINTLISSSGTQIERGVSLVSQTGEVLTDMMASIVQISDRVGDIAASSAEQSTGLREINVAINNLDQTTQKNAAMFEETSAATVSLATEADQLTNAMAQFTIREDHAESSSHSDPQGDLAA